MKTLTGHARLAGVMGWPVTHSRSPRLHGFWLAQHDIDGAYLPLTVRPENLASALRALPALGFAGVKQLQGAIQTFWGDSQGAH